MPVHVMGGHGQVLQGHVETVPVNVAVVLMAVMIVVGHMILALAVPIAMVMPAAMKVPEAGAAQLPRRPDRDPLAERDKG